MHVRINMTLDLPDPELVATRTLDNSQPPFLPLLVHTARPNRYDNLVWHHKQLHVQPGTKFQASRNPNHEKVALVMMQQRLRPASRWNHLPARHQHTSAL